MSIEVILYPAHATRNELVALLKARGYRETSHLWDWPNGTVNFHWFKTEDFTSFDGVEASVFPPSSEECAKFGVCEWALHTRTRVAASSGDRNEQNAVIRVARQKFKGRFHNDWHGTNRYTPPDSEQQSPVARGIFQIHLRTIKSLRDVALVLPHPIEGFAKLEGTEAESLATDDPTRTLYNALVPFAVAALEHFFGQAFRILLRYDAKAKTKLSQMQKKVDFADVLSISVQEKAIEDVVADWYSFQNIESIHKAFNEWFGIDIWKLLRQRRKVGKRIDWLEKRFTNLIEFRHGIVHRFEFSPWFKRQDIKEILDLSMLLIDIFVEHLELSRKETIRIWPEMVVSNRKCPTPLKPSSKPKQLRRAT